MNQLIRFLLIVCLLFIPCQILQADKSSTDARVIRLRCEYLENPLGIDIQKPRFSWIIESDQPEQRQTAYQILIASEKQLLEQNNADLWDSGKVISGESVHIPYSAIQTPPPLHSHRPSHGIHVRVHSKPPSHIQQSQRLPLCTTNHLYSCSLVSIRGSCSLVSICGYE